MLISVAFEQVRAHDSLLLIPSYVNAFVSSTRAQESLFAIKMGAQESEFVKSRLLVFNS